jgi:choice-of-anchor A domain-containing protein/LPXTG-motif cell wall-anchored protein
MSKPNGGFMKIFNYRNSKRLFAAVFAFVLSFSQTTVAHAADNLTNDCPGWECDWVSLGDKGFYKFSNTLTQSDYAQIAVTTGVKNPTIANGAIKLEYHYIDSKDEQFASSKSYNPDLALGTAGNFHIVAFDTATLGAHINGNVLCNNLVAGSNFGTNGYNETSAYVANDYVTVSGCSGSTNTNPLVLGNQAKLGLTETNSSFMVNNSKLDRPKIIYRDSPNLSYININKVKDEMIAISSSLAARPETSNISITSENCVKTYTLNDPDGVATINLTAEELASLPTDVFFKGFKTDHSGTVIVNVDCNNENVTLPERAYVFIDGKQQGTNEVTQFAAGKVIWNFTNCSGTTIQAKNMTGTIIALGASVLLTQNINGTIIANNTKNTAETHRTDFTGKLIDSSVSFKVSKNFKDNNWPEGTTYNVSLAADPAAENNAPLPKSTTIELDKTGNTKQFDAISYEYDSAYKGKTIEYDYAITEDNGKINNVTYSDTKYRIKVFVDYEQNEIGDKSATVTKTQYSTDGKTWNDFDAKTFEFNFVNTYVKPSTTATLSVNKMVDGADAPAEKFNFTLGAVTEGAPLPDNTAASCADKGTATFGTINYGAADAGKTYIYSITETAGTTLGMSYSKATQYAKVVVSDDVKSATVTYGTSAEDTKSTEVPTITNTYVKPSTTATLSVNKMVDGADAPAEKFNFTLGAVTEGAPLPDNTAASCADKGTATFGTINYGAADAGKTYIYSITETAGTTLGMSYSKATQYAKVVVSDDVKSATVTYGTSAEDTKSTEVPTITNTYVKPSTTATLSVNKMVDGADAPAEKFNFTLGAVTEGAPLPDNTAASCADKGTATFGTINYGAADAGKTYIYSITETAGTTLGMSYSKATQYAKVVVSDDVKSATVTYGTSAEDTKSTEVPTITNTYVKPSTTATLSVNKMVDGADAPAEKFNFTLGAVTEGAPLPDNTAASCADKGTATFGTINYGAADAGKTYIYSITETAGTTLGMSYSKATQYAKVVVSDDVKSATVTYGTSAEDTKSTEVPTITNTYVKPSTTATLSVNKMVDGADAPAEKFNFTLGAVTEGAPLPDNTAASCADKGTATFGTINYGAADAGKTYIYSITETAGTTLGMSYSKATQYAKVVVSDDVKSATVTYGTSAEDTKSTEVPTITNTYVKPSTTATLSVNKMVDGADAPAEKFNFTLGAVTEGAPLPDNTAASCADKGTATFGTINYGAADAGKTYIYSITETAGTTLGMSYSKATQYAKVVVSDDVKSATVTYGTSAEDTKSTEVPTITNTYVKPSTTATLSVNKMVDGADAPAEKFNFTLGAVTEGAPLPDNTAASCADKGTATFGTINYGAADAGKTYIYSITETAGTTLGMSYSKATQYAKVVVSDDVKSATVTYGTSAEDTKSTEVPTITNTYVKPSTTATLSVNKMVDGADAPAEKFNFTLGAVTEGAPLPDNTAASCADKGTATFGTINYGAADAGKTYIYSITETAGTTLGMSYSKATQYAKVVVSDDVKSATVTYGTSAEDTKSTEAPTITNTYVKQVGNLVISKSFDGDNITDEDKANLKFEVTYPDGTVKTVAYSEFTDGKYTLENVPNGDYKVREVNPEIKGYDVTVTTTVDGKTSDTAAVATKATSTIEIKDSYTKRPTTPITPDTPTPTPSAPTTPTPERPTTPTTTDRPHTPNTGDQTNAGMAAGAFGFSMLIAGFAVFFKKKYSA